MKFKKRYIDYTDEEIEVSETEMHQHFETALSDKFNRSAICVATTMARSIFSTFNTQQPHDVCLKAQDYLWQDVNYIGELVVICEKYVKAHKDEFIAARKQYFFYPEEGEHMFEDLEEMISKNY